MRSLSQVGMSARSFVDFVMNALVSGFDPFSRCGLFSLVFGLGNVHVILPAAVILISLALLHPSKPGVIHNTVRSVLLIVLFYE